MRKVIQKREVIVIKKEIVKRYCDFCKKEIPKGIYSKKEFGKETNWKTLIFHQECFKIKDLRKPEVVELKNRKAWCPTCRMPMNKKGCIKEGEKRFVCTKCGYESN